MNHLRQFSRTAGGRANAAVIHIGNHDNSNAMAAPLMAVGDLHGEDLPSCLIQYSFCSIFQAVEM